MSRSKRKTALALIAGVLACVAILMTGPQPLEGILPDEKPTVATGEFERTTTAKQYTAYGALRPRQILSLATQVAGEVSWVNPALNAGRQVDGGEDLFRIDARDFAVAVARVEASYVLAKSDIELEQGRSEIARLEWQAWQTENSEDLAASPLALRAPQQAQAKARLDVIGAELEVAKLALTRTSVRSRWPASIIQANAVVGQILNAGDSVAILYPLDFALVEVQVPPQLLQLLESGLHVIELRPAYDLKVPPVRGELDAIVRNLSEENRLATVRVRVEQPLANPGWVFGMHLEARLIAAEQRVVTHVPHELIVGGNLVWIYRDGRALRHQVFPVGSSSDSVLVEDNFQQGDLLIKQRPIGLFDGAEVEVSEV